MYQISPMTGYHANSILHWFYAPPYSLYGFIYTEEAAFELICGNYFSCCDEDGQLVGFFSFRTAAQIPTVEASPYSPDRLDMGLGMNPDYCDRGLGREFVRAGMAFAQQYFSMPLRLTVACWNERAIRVYKDVGFRTVGTVTHKNSEEAFYIMNLM